MNKFLPTAAFASFSGFVSTASAEDIVPCEDLLKTTKDTLAAATTPAAADKTKVDETPRQ